MHSVSVARLFEDQREELQLEQLSESLASRREITVSDVNRPGMALMGLRTLRPLRTNRGNTSCETFRCVSLTSWRSTGFARRRRGR